MPDDALPSGKPLRLLEAVPNKVYNRLIVRYPYRTDSDYAYFYHEAANRLAGTYTGKPDDDTILLPFLMLYRHAFELELKNLFRFLANIRYRYREPGNSELRREAIDETLRNEIRHNLAKLLNVLLGHYDALRLPEKFPESVKKLILMLHEADRSGTAFRYAGRLPEPQDHTDFPDLVAMLNEEFTLLGSVEDWLDAMYEAMPTPEDIH